MHPARNPPPAGGPRTEKSAAGGAAGVEIAGFPQILFTRTFGDPDMLFVPLLDAARESFNTIERLCERGEKRECRAAERHAIGFVVVARFELFAGGERACARQQLRGGA